MDYIDRIESFGNQVADLGDALHRTQQESARFKAERNEARAETTRILEDLAACQDQRAALRANVAILEISIETLQKRVTELTTCDCGLSLSTGKCFACDNDEQSCTK